MHKILITKIIIFSIFLNYTLKANRGFVNGTVISDESEPMAGANVLIENTSRGVITDSKGQFFIDSLLPLCLDRGALSYREIPFINL